jgi:hypothetical protein
MLTFTQFLIEGKGFELGGKNILLDLVDILVMEKKYLEKNI